MFEIVSLVSENLNLSPGLNNLVLTIAGEEDMLLEVTN